MQKIWNNDVIFDNDVSILIVDLCDWFIQYNIKNLICFSSFLRKYQMLNKNQICDKNDVI